MFRRGLFVSSPSAAAPSNPAQERKPKTEANAIAPMPTPAGGLNGFRGKSWPVGAEPAITLTKIQTTRIRMSVTETASIAGRDRVAKLTSLEAPMQISGAAAQEMTVHP